MYKPRSAGPARRSRVASSAMLRIAAVIPVGRSVLVLVCLLGSGVAEGVGVASLIPLIIAAGSAGGKHSAVADSVLRAVQTVGLPTDPLYLLIISMVGVVLKALLS